MADVTQKAVSKENLLYFWQGIKTKLAGKVDVETGKGLSANDFTNEYKDKLDKVAAEATKVIVEDVLTSDSAVNALSAKQGKALNTRIGEVEAKIPTRVGQLENDAGYLTEHQDISGKLDVTGDGSNVTAAFTQAATRGNIASGEKLSVIFGKIAKYFADLKAVAFSGSYNDLTDKPEIPVVTNDLTNELKANYDAAYTHSQAAHAPADAQANIIEGIQINNVDAQVSNKKVNIKVPTTVAEMTDAANYALKADLTNVYKYAGSVATVADLPAGLGAVTDTVPVYNVEADGMNYAWNGTAWDNLGTIFTVEYLSNTEIDEILAA